MRRNLGSPRFALDDLIAEETRSAGTHLSLHQLLPGARSASIAAKRGSIQKAEAALRLLAELAGAEQIELEEMKTILGQREFDRYLKIYEARSKERYQARGYLK